MSCQEGNADGTGGTTTTIHHHMQHRPPPRPPSSFSHPTLPLRTRGGANTSTCGKGCRNPRAGAPSTRQCTSCSSATATSSSRPTVTYIQLGLVVGWSWSPECPQHPIPSHPIHPYPPKNIITHIPRHPPTTPNQTTNLGRMQAQGGPRRRRPLRDDERHEMRGRGRLHARGVRPRPHCCCCCCRPRRRRHRRDGRQAGRQRESPPPHRGDWPHRALPVARGVDMGCMGWWWLVDWCVGCCSKQGGRSSKQIRPPPRAGGAGGGFIRTNRCRRSEASDATSAPTPFLLSPFSLTIDRSIDSRIYIEVAGMDGNCIGVGIQRAICCCGRSVVEPLYRPQQGLRSDSHTHTHTP